MNAAIIVAIIALAAFVVDLCVFGVAAIIIHPHKMRALIEWPPGWFWVRRR